MRRVENIETVKTLVAERLPNAAVEARVALASAVLEHPDAKLLVAACDTPDQRWSAVLDAVTYTHKESTESWA
ncbi:MAG: hypothetical protein JSS20_18730 [Proteobacteria bacterium]|nr:hypothetical protein [Pseudomonadota bacterium]